MKYIIIAAISLFSSIVLFFTLKEFKKSRYFLIALIWTALCAYFGIQFYFEKPIITLLGEQKLKIEVQDTYVDNGAKATYRFKDVTDKIKTNGNVDTAKVGNYKIKYEIDLDNKKVEAERIVEVVDDISPIITLSGDTKVIASSIELYTEPGFSVTDNYDKDLDEKVVVETVNTGENLYQKKYTVVDSSGNTGTAKREVEIKDIVPPRISLKGTGVENVYQGGTYSDSGATATDDLDGDVSYSITTAGSVDTSKIGTYKITYQAKDKSGNISTAERTVQVIEKKQGGTVYLTFDDGPSTTITPHVLDILKEENVKATFFILDYNDSTEYLVKRIVNEGHTIAIHGYSHDYYTIYQSEEAYMENLNKLREKIKITTGVDATITRFPGGSSNLVSSYNPGIMTRLVKKVIDEGYRYFDWNVSSGDAGGASTPKEVYNNVTNNLSHKRSNVVLMHDFSGNTKTLNALRDIIHYCKNNGYAIEKITNSTPMITHRVAN